MKPTWPPPSETLKKPLRPLTDRQRKIICSPQRLVVTLVVSIFLIELADMRLVDGFFPQLSSFQRTLLDAALLITTLFPILFFYLFRPLAHLVHDCNQNETELRNYQSHLEQRVAERTRDLEEALQRLKIENQDNQATRRALSESEERFRQLFAHNEDAVILIAPEDGRIIDINPTAETIFRKNRAEILSGGLRTLCDGSQQLPHLKETLGQIVHDDAASRIDRFECAIAPNDLRVLSFRGKIITLQGAKVVYATFRDITTRTRLEEEALEIQARLIQANRMTSLGTMVSSVAHEINNPNNFLLINARILKDAWADVAPIVENHFHTHGDFPVAESSWSEARHFLPEAIDGVQQGALRISSIVGNLKEAGRDNRFNARSLADVNAVVQLSVSILNHHISRATRRFRLELTDDLPLVHGSARQLEQVVINLIQNALQALPDPQHGVRVSTGSDAANGQILIQVADEGAGIPPEIANRIMEPFFTTRLEHGGTGLGLAISSSIVKEHGGSIEFQSVAGKGTTFTVRLHPEAKPESRTC